MSATPADHGSLRPEPPKTYYEGVVRIPGQEAPPDRCRDIMPVGFCNHGHTVLGRSSCGTRYCPEHWRDWIEDAVISMVARMAAYRHHVDGAEKRVSHVVASPPQDRRYSSRELWNTRRDAYDALRDAGVRGGPVITHPYRTNERGDNQFSTAKEQGEVEDDRGRWSFLREMSEGWEDLTRYIEAAPHYHVPLAPAEDIQPADAPEDWIIKRIRTMSPFVNVRDTEAYRDMVAPAYYVLTHAASQTGKHSTTWFGETHPANFDPEEALTAAAWSRIQMEAERAVTERPGEDDSEGSLTGPDECPRDGCEAAVYDLGRLDERMRNDDWIDQVSRGRNGREKLARLHGTRAWWDGMTDRPPPSVQSDRERMKNWLEVQGEVFLPSERQGSLAGFGAGYS